MKARLTKLFTLLTILTLGITSVWGDEIFSWTATSAIAKNASEAATGGTVSCSGSNMGSKFTPTGGPDYYKFSSSTVLTFTLSSGTFAAGDVISFTYTNASSGTQNVGVIIQETSPKTNVVSDVAKGIAETQTYTIVASDGIAGKNKFSVMRGGSNASNFAIRTVSVTRSSGGGGDPVCPSGLTISSKNDQVDFTEGEKIELTAALSAGNGDISYQWYKGSVAPANAISGATNAKYEVASCTTADEGDYFCVASKTSCDDAVNASAFAITVEADTKCFNMPAITNKPADLASVVVTGGTLSDVSTAKAVAMNASGLKLDGNSVYLKVTLSSSSIVEGTKITVAWKGAGSGAGIAVVNGDLAEKVIDETGVATAGSVTHTFTAAEAANYADEFIIHRNASGTGIYVNAITVEDCGPAVTKHTVTLNYNDGATADGSLTVVDGEAAVKPADPTRGKYTFLGWFVGDTDNEYVWSTAVTGDITLKAHWQDPWTITFDSNGGSAVADITVKHNTLAEKPADPTWDGYDFNGWTEGGSPFDWTAAITGNHALVADWITEVAKYDIEYYDGDTKIGTEEQVRADLHPTATGISTDKALYTFVGWYLSSTLEGDPVALNTVTPVEGLKLYGKWVKAYASNADFEAYIIANPGEKDDADKAEAYVKSLNYALSTKTGTTFDANNSSNNGAYAGLKIKNSGTKLSWNVVAGKVVELKAGVMVANGSLAINGGAATTIDGGTTGTGDNFKIHYFYSAAEALYEFTTSNGSAEVIKAITMRDPYTVSFEAHGDADPTELPGQPSVTLPNATNGTASLLGWFDAETGGNKIGDAGDSYTPTANITLHAQWEAVSTDARLASITFSSAAGTLEPAFDPEVVNYTYTMPYPTAAVPTITGATSVNANAQDPVIDAQASAWGETAIIRGVAESGDSKAYNITMLKAPKDGIAIISIDVPNGNGNAQTIDAANISGVIGGTATQKLQSGGTKLGSNGHYIGFTLANSETLHAGDIIRLNVSATNGASHLTLYQDASNANLVKDITWTAATGVNLIPVPAEAVGLGTLYIYRTSSACNPSLSEFAILRPMAPVLQKVTVNGVEGVPVGTAVTLEVPASTTQAQLEAIAFDWISNDDAWTAAHTPAATNAWEFGVANTITLTDKDGDASVYTVTVNKIAASNDATLSELAYGVTPITLVPDVYDYVVDLAYGESSVPALSATKHHVGATDPVIVDAAGFTNLQAVSTVTVTAEDGITTQVYTVTFNVARFPSIILWDGSTMSAVVANGDPSLNGITWASTGVSVTSFTGKICADNGKTYTHALDFGGKTQSSRQFSITIPDGNVARVSLVYRAKGTSARSLFVGTALSDVIDEKAVSYITVDGNSSDLFAVSFDLFAAGTLYINTTDGFHIHEISIQMAPGYARSDMLGAGVLGTICVDHNVAIEDAFGASFYELAGKESTHGKIVFDEIVSGELEAGVPYVFQAEGNLIALLYGATTVTEPDNSGALKGTFTGETFSAEDAASREIYFFRDRALWSAKETGLRVLANRAWLEMGSVNPASSPNPAPGRRRITLGVNGTNVATGLEDLEVGEAPMKVMMNGQLFILRGERIYDATGRLVK